MTATGLTLLDAKIKERVLVRLSVRVWNRDKVRFRARFRV